MSYDWNDDPRQNEDVYSEPYYEGQYDDQGYEVQPYDDYVYMDEPPPSRSPFLLTVVLIVGVVACSCLSCLVGVGLGLVGWEELNYTPSAAASSQLPSDDAAQQSFGVTYQPSDVVAAFRQAGLECESPEPTTPDASLPFNPASSIRFVIPALSPDYTARIYSFDSPRQLDAARAYFEDRIQADLAYFSWVFVKDNILVDISGDLPDDWASNYEAALMGMS